MKRRLFILSLIPPLLFLAVSLSGCALEPAAEVPADNPENIYETDLATRTARPVALEDALGEMYSLMDAIDAGEGTRSAGRRNVASVELLGAKQLSQTATRSGEPILDSLLYLVNFVEGGFAVLGADESLASVIALTAAGQINAGDFDIPSTAVNYTLEDLWVEEDQDYLLGGVDASSGTGFVARIILDYAVNGNNPGGLGIDDGSGQGTDPDGNGEGPVTPVLPPGGGGGNNGPTYTYIYEWVVDNNTGVLLTTNWHQRSPFNDFVEFFKPEGTTAGCVAIAVMQIMAHHESPACTGLYYTDGDSALKAAIAAEMTADTDTVTWRGLKASDLSRFPDSLLVLPGSRAAAASISLKVGKGMNMIYNLDNDGSSFTTPNQAKKYLNRRGYDATRYISYNEDKIKSELKEHRRPVILGALGDFSHGHAWVLDGWMERHEKKIAVRDSDGQRTVVNENVRSQKLVHCNWGWTGGSCNGYYVSDTFFSTKNGAEIPDPQGGTQDFYYSWWFRTVTVKP